MKRIIIFLAIPLLVQSCSSIYIPANRSIPLLEKKGEFQGEAGVSTNSVYVNGSYAFTDDIAVSINGNLSYRNFTDYYDVLTHKDDLSTSSFLLPDYRGQFAHRYGEVSLGKMNMLPPTFPMKMEVFSGMGMGRATDTDDSNNDNYYKSDYYSFFGQVNFGLKKRIVEAGGSMRLAYSMFNYAIYIENKELLGQSKFHVFHAEPVIFARVGGKNLKAVFRVGLNFAFTINPIEEYAGLRGINDHGRLEYTIFHFSVGMSYRITGK